MKAFKHINQPKIEEFLSNTTYGDEGPLDI
jgi:hypothetical protein